MSIVNLVGIDLNVVEVERPVLEIFKGELFFKKLVQSLVEGVLDEVPDGVQVRYLIGDGVE